MRDQLQKNTGETGENDVGLIDILLILSKHKRKIIVFPLVCGIIGILVSFIIPNIYRANTKILPPQQSQSSASSMLSQLSGLTGGAGASLGLKNPNDLYISLLKSRTLTDRLIQRFDLKSRYNQIYLESTRTQLESRSSITSGKDHIISIDFEDTDPKIAAEIANAYAEELTTLTSKLALTEAAQRRLFYEKQLELARDRMINAENNLASNITSSGLQSVDVQSKAILETTARLRAGISAKEIQLKALQNFVTPNNQQFKSIQQELIGMKAELSKLESGSRSEIFSKLESKTEGSENQKFTKNNFQLLREVKYYQTLYEMLLKQFEIARIDEAKDLPLIQVLDQATAPERKIKPQKTLIITAAFFSGLIAAFIFIFSSEFIIKSKTQANKRKSCEPKEALDKR